MSETTEGDDPSSPDQGRQELGHQELGRQELGHQELGREGAIVRVLEICNKKGLHARASAKFVQTVEQFDAQVWVTKGHETVGGDSIMGLMMLAAGTGSAITVEAVGPQAAEVLDALAALVSSRFAEND